MTDSVRVEFSDLVGDGEGNLLTLALDEYPELTDHCARAASLVHFGAPRRSSARGPRGFRRSRGTAQQRSDRLPRTFRRRDAAQPGAAETYVRPIQGLACVHRYLTLRERPRARLEDGRDGGLPPPVGPPLRTRRPPQGDGDA